jgi:hypothetical protein
MILNPKYEFANALNKEHKILYSVGASCGQF